MLLNISKIKEWLRLDEKHSKLLTLWTAKFSPQRESMTVTFSWGTNLCWVNGHQRMLHAFFGMSCNLCILSIKEENIISLREVKTVWDLSNQLIRSSDMSCGTGGSTSTGTLDKARGIVLYFGLIWISNIQRQYYANNKYREMNK